MSDTEGTTPALDLERLRELLAGASESAPWGVDRLNNGKYVVFGGSEAFSVGTIWSLVDAELIAALRNAAPALLSAVASLTQEVTTYKAEVGHADAERAEAVRQRNEVRELAERMKATADMYVGQFRSARRDAAAARKQAEQAQAEIAHLTRERDEVLLWVSPQTKVTFAEQWAAKRATSVPQPKGADHPERTCGRCGGPNIPWAAPSPLWNEVMRSGDINATDTELHHGIVCPTCFAVLAEQAGVAEIWRLYPVRVLADLKTVTPSGRVWNEQTWLWEEPAAAVPSSGGQDTAADHRECDGSGWVTLGAMAVRCLPGCGRCRGGTPYAPAVGAGRPLRTAPGAAVTFRWMCPCGRFIAETAIAEETRRDPGAYYGVTTVTRYSCSRCGVREAMPWLIETTRTA